MQQIALVNFSAKLDDFDLAFAAQACNRQVVECAEDWDVPPTPVVFYSKADGLPREHCRIMSIVDDLEHPGAAGYHTADVGVIYARVLAQTLVDTIVTLSHECLEEMIDPLCNVWRKMDARRDTALEVSDAVQGDCYPTNVTVLGERRSVLVSNYVRPAWFNESSVSNFDRMGRLWAPFTMSQGGYLIVRDRVTGEEGNVFARPHVVVGGPRAHAALGMKLTRPDSRTLRRLSFGAAEVMAP